MPTYIDEYDVPTPNGGPLALTVDKNGMIWFTESNASKIGKFDPVTHTFSEYDVPGVGDMWGIAIDKNDMVWFTQYAGRGDVNPRGSIMSGGKGRLGRLDPANLNVSFVDMPSVGSFPFRLVVDPDNKIWFTELLGNRTGFFDQKLGNLTEYKVSETLSGPTDLAFDRDGALWFTESFDHNIVRLDPQTKTLTEYSLEALVFSPAGISIDREGHVWVADHGGDWIAEFDPSTQSVTRYPTHRIHGDLTIPNGLLIDAKGRVWFCEHVGNAVGYLDPQTLAMVEFTIPTGPVSGALWIALAPNGDIWFTEWVSNKLGVVHAGRQVPLTLQALEDQLRLESGTRTTITLGIEAIGGTPVSGSFDYSWGTYSTSDVSISFSPPSLSGESSASVEAKLTVSDSARPGDYILGLGINMGPVRVWTMLETQVVARSLPPQPPLTTLIIPTIILAGLGAFLVVRQIRRRPRR